MWSSSETEDAPLARTMSTPLPLLSPPLPRSAVAAPPSWSGVAHGQSLPSLYPSTTADGHHRSWTTTRENDARREMSDRQERANKALQTHDDDEDEEERGGGGRGHGFSSSSDPLSTWKQDGKEGQSTLGNNASPAASFPCIYASPCTPVPNAALPPDIPVVRRERIVIRPRIPGSRGAVNRSQGLVDGTDTRPSRAMMLHLSLIIPFCTGQWFSLMLRYGWRGFLIQNVVMTVTLGFIGYSTICFQLLRKHLKRSTSELSDYGTIVVRQRTLPDGTIVAEEDHIIVEMVSVKVDYIHFFHRLFSTTTGVVVLVMVGIHVYFLSWMLTMIQTLNTLNALLSGAGVLVELLIYEVM